MWDEEGVSPGAGRVAKVQEEGGALAQRQGHDLTPQASREAPPVEQEVADGASAHRRHGGEHCARDQPRARGGDHHSPHRHPPRGAKPARSILDPPLGVGFTDPPRRPSVVAVRPLLHDPTGRLDEIVDRAARAVD